jgi:hypothetical protein
MAHYNSFIVRMWRDGTGRLYGRVVHVATQQMRYFMDLDCLVEFIRERSSRDPAGEAALLTTDEAPMLTTDEAPPTLQPPDAGEGDGNFGGA